MFHRIHIKLLFLFLFAVMLQAGTIGKCWSDGTGESAEKKLNRYIEKISKFKPLEGLGFSEIKFKQTNSDNVTSFTASMVGQISIPVPDLTLLADTVTMIMPEDISVNFTKPFSFPLTRAKVPFWFSVELKAKYKNETVDVALSFWGDEKDVYVDVKLLKSFKLSDLEYVADKVHLKTFKIPMQNEFGFTNPANYSINNPEFIFNISKANITVYGDVEVAARSIGVYLYQVPNVEEGNLDQLNSSAGYAKAKKGWNLMFDFGALDMGEIIKKVAKHDLGTGKVENLLMILSLIEINLPVKYFDRAIRTSYMNATGDSEWTTHIVGEGVSFLTGLNPNHFSEIKKYLDEMNLKFANNLILMGDLHFKVVKAEKEESGEGEESGESGEAEEGEGGDESGEDGGSSSEAEYELYLAAQLPTWEIPQYWQKRSIVQAQGADMSFFIKVIPGAVEFGVATDFLVKIGSDNLKLTGALECVVTEVDIGVALAGMMRGTWNIPYSPGLALKDPTLKVKVTEDDSYFVGVSGTTFLAGKEVMVGGDIEIEYTGEEAHPKAGAIKGSLNSLGFQDLAKIANVCIAMKNETWKPWQAPSTPIPVENLKVDVEIKDVYFEFVTPGAADPDLGFSGTGFAMMGTLYINNELSGKVLFNINELGVKGIEEISAVNFKAYVQALEKYVKYVKSLHIYEHTLDKVDLHELDKLKKINELSVMIRECLLALDKIEGYAFSGLKKMESLKFDGYKLEFVLNTSEIPRLGIIAGFQALKQKFDIDVEIYPGKVTVDLDFPKKKLISQYIPDVTIKKATFNKKMGIDIEAAITLQAEEIDIEGVVDLEAKKISLTGKIPNLKAGAFISADGSVTVSGAYNDNSIDLRADAEGHVNVSGVNLGVKGPFNKEGIFEPSFQFPNNKLVIKNAPDITIHTPGSEAVKHPKIKLGTGWGPKFVTAGDDNNIFTVQQNGDLRHYVYTGDGTGSWTVNKIDSGSQWLGYTHVFAGPANTIYATKPDGTLLWFKTLGVGKWATGSGNTIGTGWNVFKHIFYGGNNVIYGIKPNGDLHWYKRKADNYTRGNFEHGSGTRIGTGWNTYSKVFATHPNHIYGIKPDGTLHMYKRTGSGKGRWVHGSGRVIGTGWQEFKRVFANSEGIIYAIERGGNLIWYKRKP